MKNMKEKNYGVEILRMFLCFWVVLFHCLKKSDNNLILKFKRKMFHVPTFFFISFFFLFPVIREKNINKMKLRLERLAIPYFYWPIITWSINNILFLSINKSIFDRILPFYKLAEQLIVGRVIIGQFWFLFNLIFFTIIFFILSLILQINNLLKLFQLLTIISFILQYSKYNYFFFDNYKDCISHSVGHFCESFPIATVSFILNFNDVINKLRAYNNAAIFYCFIGTYFIYKYGIFMKIEKYGNTYNYNGLDKIFFALFSFIFFYLIPFEKIHSKKIKIFIKIISNYTQGIFSIHLLIFTILSKYVNFRARLRECFIIYLLSYLVSFIGAKLCQKNKFKFLFI